MDWISVLLESIQSISILLIVIGMVIAFVWKAGFYINFALGMVVTIIITYVVHSVGDTFEITAVIFGVGFIGSVIIAAIGSLLLILEGFFLSLLGFWVYFLSSSYGNLFSSDILVQSGVASLFSTSIAAYLGGKVLSLRSRKKIVVQEPTIIQTTQGAQVPIHKPGLSRAVLATMLCFIPVLLGLLNIFSPMIGIRSPVVYVRMAIINIIPREYYTWAVFSLENVIPIFIGVYLFWQVIKNQKSLVPPNVINNTIDKYVNSTSTLEEDFSEVKERLEKLEKKRFPKKGGLYTYYYVNRTYYSEEDLYNEIKNVCLPKNHSWKKTLGFGNYICEKCGTFRKTKNTI